MVQYFDHLIPNQQFSYAEVKIVGKIIIIRKG